MTKKSKMYNILKIKIQQLPKCDFDLKLTNEEEKKLLIKQQDTPLFRQLTLIRGKDVKKVSEIIFVEAKRNRNNEKSEEDLLKLLKEGFTYNGVHYRRFGKSSSQAKDGVTVFIDSVYFDEMLKRSQLDVEMDKCIISKYESYRCLILSSCNMVNEKLPNIVIIDEYEKYIPKQHVRYAIEKDMEYINKKTKEKFIVKKQKFIEEKTIDVKISPFDGFGLHTPEYGEVLNKYTRSEYKSSLFQIRLPFMKGVTVEFNFKKYLKEVLKVTEIKDAFGRVHNVDDIDCIWNTTMWKGYSIFKKEFGNEGWDKYLEKINKYNYQIGISKYSHHTDEINIYARLNFQYLQCLDLMNPKYLEQFKEKTIKYDVLDENSHGKIINIAKYSTDLFEKIIKGEKLYTLKFLGVNDTTSNELRSKYIEAILINDDMLKDPSIKKMLKRKLDKSITQMKYGKIYTSGFYHTVIGDIVGYLEYSAGLRGENIKGCLNGGEFFVKTLPSGECVSMRSPLVDPSEVNKVKLVSLDNSIQEYFDHFDKQDICMINMFDLTMQQQGGMDEDGDTVFLTNNEIIINSKIEKPIVVDLADKVSCDPVEYNIDNITQYELNSRDNRIGEITNIATSILNTYTESEKWKKINEDNVALLRLYQGKEIDFLKTGFRWVITKNLREYLKRLPYFLLFNYPKKLKVYNRLREINKEVTNEDKVQYNAFRSPSAMNELCDYINQWERKKINWNNDLINNGHLLSDKNIDYSDKTLIKKIKSIYNQFDVDFKKVLEEDDEDKIMQLKEEYQKRLYSLHKDRNLIANYCIKVAYRSLSSDKVLCWLIFGDTMINNLKNNSDERKSMELVKTDENDDQGEEFLGKHYKLVYKTEE